MKYLTIFLFLLCGGAATAQDCDREALKTLPGKWLPQPGNSVTGKLSAAEIAGAKKVLSRIQQMFQEKYRPVGMDTYHHHHYLEDDHTDKNSYGNSAIYTIRNFLLVCVKGRKETSAEGVGSYVHINPGGLFNRELSEIPVYDEYGKINNSPGFYSLRPNECPGGKLPDFSDGYHAVETSAGYLVWITYPGKQPFRYVSRREFLEKQAAFCEANLKELNKHYSSKSWKEQLEMHPQSKESILNGMKQTLGIYEMPLQAYRQDLKKDAAWLNEMAIVNYLSTTDPETKNNYLRYNFTALDDPYMSVPIMPDPGYYDRNLPKWAPQFITISVRQADSFISQNVRKVADENIEFFNGLLAKTE